MSSSQATAGPNFSRIQPMQCVNARLRRIHRMINTAYQQSIRPFGLRGSMLSILFIIGKQAPINQKMVADMLVLDPSTMSRDLKKLVAKGWVQINRGTDPRHSELSLTQSGYDLLEEVSPVWEALHQKVSLILGQHNLHQIDILATVIQANLDKIP